MDLEEEWLSESYRNSLLLELKTINSEIEKADSSPSQSNFEILRESLLLAVEIINSGSRDDYWIFIELLYSLSLVLVTISEVDSPPLRLIIERLQSCPFFKEAIWLRRFTYPPSQLFLDRPSHVTLKNKLYLYFCCSSGRYRYILFEIELPISFHYPPTKATQDAEIRNPTQFRPILQLETSKYPDGMCCVQLGLELYFFGGKFNIDKPGEDEKVKALPQDVYVFNLTLYHKCPHLLRRMKEDMLLPRTPMHSGKASPLAFVADAKIYVIGSKLEDKEDESLFYFELYDPCKDEWSVLPNPPERRCKWVGNTVVGRNAFLVEMQEQRPAHFYCFNLEKEQWTRICRDGISRGLDCYRYFTGKTEFVANRVYGCYHNTVVKLALTDEDLREIDLSLQFKEEEEEGGEEEEEEEEEEGGEGEEEEEEEGGEGGEEGGEEEEEEEGEEGEDEFQQVARLLSSSNCDSLRMVSKEKGMDAIYNVPRQLQSSTTLLHLGSGYFCYVRTGKPPPQIQDEEASDDDIPSNRDCSTSIVIFQTAPRETYEENMPRFFRAQFVYSKHYKYYSRFGEDVFIKGCYALGRLV